MLPLFLIVLFPLAGCLINGLFGAKLKKPAPGIIASAAVLLSFVVALLRFINLTQQPENLRRAIEPLYTWIQAGSFSVDVSFLLDQLSGVMILIITGIGLLIHIYSVGYMQHDHNDPESRLNARYFAFLNLFIAFMSLLVLADNFLLMFVGWEGVGLCSYFLIGFWFQREDAAEASKKAFVMNRIGDFGFLLAMMLIFLLVGSLKFDVVQGIAQNLASQNSTGLAGAAGIITLLLFLGAAGKSAQIPLFTWLPDAMAGPTPVSALIHAATMVTAGVYMCARVHYLFDLAPTVKVIICVVGALTALAAGLTALAHRDIKKVLAYSTVSQLGFMFMAIGAGAYVAAIFHVFTHAFFKACLFLGSGSVIHALHGEQDMAKMGGLARKMKTTYLTFMLSGLALAGAVPFAGFFSKDEIIAAVFSGGTQGENGALYLFCGVVGLLTAFITALYTGRQYAQVFLGEPRDEHLFEGAHESPASMTIPLWILAAGAVFAGFLGLPYFDFLPAATHAFANWLDPLLQPVVHAGTAEAAEHAVAAPNPLLLLLGAALGWGGWFVGRNMGLNSAQAALPETVNRWSLDAAYNATVVRVGFALASALRWIDEKVINGIVNGVGTIIGQIATSLRLTQTSFVRNYALGMAVGAAVVIALFLVR